MAVKSAGLVVSGIGAGAPGSARCIGFLPKHYQPDRNMLDHWRPDRPTLIIADYTLKRRHPVSALAPRLTQRVR